MTFLVPIGLLSLLALPLILVLHLVRRRRRNVRVPSLELWTATATPLRHKRRRLPLTLLLLLHLLVAALIGLSLGRPRLPGSIFEPTNTVAILDTSSSMAARDGTTSAGATRFAAAQAAARQLLAGARPGDRIGLVTLGARPQLLGRGGPEASGALLDALTGLRPAGPDGDLAAALELAVAAQPGATEPMRTRLVVLTDPSYRQPTTDDRRPTTAPQPPDPGPRPPASVEWRTFGAAADNVALVAFAARPLRDGGHQLYARVANFGRRPAARDLQILLDGEVVETASIRLDSDAEAEWSWPLPGGARVAEARLSPEDAAPLDDGATTVLVGGARQRIQLVSATPTPLERSLRAQPGTEVTLALPATYRHDPAADAVVFVDFVPPGLPPIPTLIVAPPQDNTFIHVAGTERDLRADGTRDPRFAALDLRSVLFSRVALVETPQWADVTLAAGETPLVLTGIVEHQPRMIWTFDPATSDLAGRLAFPLLTAATLRTLLPRSGSVLAVGELAPRAVVAPDGTTLPAGSLLAARGLYRWADLEGAVAVNALDTGESDLRQQPRPTIEQAPATAGSTLRDTERPLWRPLLAAALALLMLEWLYSHRHALRRSPPTRRRTA